MENAAPYDAQINLARYYLRKLSSASMYYQRGHENTSYALTLLNQEWSQIKHWQNWANEHMYLSDYLTKLSLDYSLQGEDLLNLRQTPQERLDWAKAGVMAARKIQNCQAEVICLFRMAWATHKQDLLSETEAIAHTALTLAESIEDFLYMGRILHLLGDILIRQGNYDEAKSCCLQSLNLLADLRAEVYLIDVYFALSEILYLKGNLSEAYNYALQSADIIERYGVERGFGNTYNWLGVLSFEVGNDELGERYLLQSIEDSRMKGIQINLAHGLGALGYLETCQQRYVEAAKHFEESLQMAHSIGEIWLIRIIELEQAYLFYLVGDSPTAKEILYRSIEYGRNSGHLRHLVQALTYLAEVQIGDHELTHSSSSLAEAITISLKNGNWLETTRCLLVAAKYSYRSEKPEQAAEWLGVLLSQQNVIAPIMDAGLRLYDDIKKSPNKERLQDAFQRGKTLDLRWVIQSIQKELESSILDINMS